MGFGRKRPHDRQVNVPFAFIISRIAALLPSDLSPSRTMSPVILLLFCDREVNQKRRIVTSTSTRRTGDDGHLKYSLDRSHVKRIPWLGCRNNIIVSTMPQLTRASCTCLHRHSATTGLSPFLCKQAIWPQVLLLIRLTRAPRIASLRFHPFATAFVNGGLIPHCSDGSANGM